MQQTTTVGDILILRVGMVSEDNDHKDNSHVPFEKTYREHEVQRAVGVAGVEPNSQDGMPPNNVYKLKFVIEHRGVDKSGHYVTACASSKAEGEWVMYDDDRCVACSWKDISRMKASTLIYEKQATGRMGEVKTQLDFSHGSAGTTCSRRPTRTPASSKLPTRGRRYRTKCRHIASVRHKRSCQRVYMARMQSGRARRRNKETAPRRSRRYWKIFLENVPTQTQSGTRNAERGAKRF